MPLKLMFITNDKHVAKIAERNGVDWIFVDLEINGKEKRQGHLDTVISGHDIEDVRAIKSVLSTSKLLVRANPIYEGSKDEIDKIIQYGSDIIMLPYFKYKEEVETFIDYVAGRAKVCLLLETPQAVEKIDSILRIPGIDYVHIGLNDLHLGYGMKFLFELLADGTVERICNKIREYNLPYGFGGIARLGKGALEAEYILGEHYRLGSSMVILSRSFLNTSLITDLADIEKEFTQGVRQIREYEAFLKGQDQEFFAYNKKIVSEKVDKIIKGL
ncbi:2-keto-3-deoxy-L-rhamnonate aldolase RhmA [Herbinix hemicellulosilytica]|uniref:HpcH/HpaI aldolase/citrate lyase domain-containing protein n=1 Tax=Herbinix hemicellulosilytica TaxID=1564487 RepID=A0A0H5SGE5_HERHM|nr:aldolase/citrate lyase family protein [Herbinix hemicellulosilytica]RBP58383.1 2-keto-3-deoxy-L-rhamnonate aldolase RhmA [Herbinix hemicellulosilytica]CRZ34100.1 hypothetical protein HHT355_0897 [Herbinix hemicellulosilytica]